VKPKIRLAVLKVLALQAEFTSSELDEAYKFIEGSQLKNILGLEKSGRRNVSVRAKINEPKKDAVRSSASEAVLERIKGGDLERYKMLDSLEKNLRTSGVDLRLDVLRRIAFSIDKSIDLGKSKKEAIPKLLDLLARIPLVDVERVIYQISNEQENSASSSNKYFKLASYIVKGG